MLPMGQSNHNELKMPGFNWEKAYRPFSIDDLFAEKPPRFPPPSASDSTPPAEDGYPEKADEESENNASAIEEKRKAMLKHSLIGLIPKWSKRNNKPQHFVCLTKI